MRTTTLWVLAAIVAATTAGCLGGSTNDDTDDQDGAKRYAHPAFSSPILIDAVRAGGEPVIAILPSGTLLVSAHPGWTHYHTGEPTHVGTELLTPANGQSYLWRSTDNGTTWDHVDLVDGVDNLPRSTALGVSDPEFTVTADGTVCMTDLLALASSSVSCSTDDGATWLPGNSLASGGPNDRQWLASWEDELYFTANYFTDHHLISSTDHGMTWEVRGDVPCSQDLVANPHTGHLVVACTRGVAVSEDGGRTWSQVREANLTAGGQRIMAEPAIDAAGNTWIATTDGEASITVVGSPDEGLTWPWAVNVTAAWRDTFAANGTFVWPWISAGSGGRFAVSWFGTEQARASAQNSGPWHVYTAFVYDATAAPEIHVVQVTPEPIHGNPICQSGTTCQVSSVTGQDSGDRRLGDFFETTIDAAGMLHLTWSNTAANPDDVISHPAYAKQTGGEPLLTAADVGVFMPTQG